MADSGKQSPLGVNVLGSVLQNTGLNINPVAAAHMGQSKTYADYTFGTVVQNTCLRLLTWSINDAYNRGVVTDAVYDNLISIGLAVNSIATVGITSTIERFTVTHGTGTVVQFPVGTFIRLSGVTSPSITDPQGYNGYWQVETSSIGSFTVLSSLDLGTATVQGNIFYGVSIPGLGNSKPYTYDWTGPSNNGSPTTALRAAWNPYNSSNGVTQWGYVRLIALQAWNEFNWNGEQTAPYVFYKDFCSSFITGSSFVDYSNSAMFAMEASKGFLQGTYSNMNDLISADVAGVNLALRPFGEDLIALGKAIDLRKISTFGLPSVLLQTIREFNAITPSLTLALLSSGLSTEEVQNIIDDAVPITSNQQQKVYGAFLIIVGVDLEDILIPLNCKTKGLESLADLLNPKKLFPNSYQSLTVPLYNVQPNLPTNSKTYYPIYGAGSVNPTLSSPSVVGQVGPQPLPGTPPVIGNRPAPITTQSYPSQQLSSPNPQFVTGPGQDSGSEFILSGGVYAGAGQVVVGPGPVSGPQVPYDRGEPPRPDWLWNDRTGTWISSEYNSFINLEPKEQRAVIQGYMAENNIGVYTTAGFEDPNTAGLLDYYTRTVTQNPGQG